MGCIGMYCPKGYVLSAVGYVIINRVLVLAILVINRLWVFFHSSFELGMFLRRRCCFVIR